MERTYVPSTNISSIGYDAATETLEIEFLSSAIYQYFNVPLNMHEQLMQAGSKGKFLHMHIKNAYPYSRVG